MGTSENGMDEEECHHPADWSGQQIKLYFEAVAGYSEVYINKEKVGENFDLFLPFSFEHHR